MNFIFQLISFLFFFFFPFEREWWVLKFLLTWNQTPARSLGKYMFQHFFLSGKRASFKTLKSASKWKCHPVDSSNSLNCFPWHLVELPVNRVLWSYLKNYMSKSWSSLFTFSLTVLLNKPPYHKFFMFLSTENEHCKKINIANSQSEITLQLLPELHDVSVCTHEHTH